MGYFKVSISLTTFSHHHIYKLYLFFTLSFHIQIRVSVQIRRRLFPNSSSVHPRPFYSVASHPPPTSALSRRPSLPSSPSTCAADRSSQPHPPPPQPLLNSISTPPFFQFRLIHFLSPFHAMFPISAYRPLGFLLPTLPFLLTVNISLLFSSAIPLHASPSFNPPQTTLIFDSSINLATRGRKTLTAKRSILNILSNQFQSHYGGSPNSRE